MCLLFVQHIEQNVYFRYYITSKIHKQHCTFSRTYRRLCIETIFMANRFKIKPGWPNDLNIPLALFQRLLGSRLPIFQQVAMIISFDLYYITKLLASPCLFPYLVLEVTALLEYNSSSVVFTQPESLATVLSKGECWFSNVPSMLETEV